MSNMNTIDLSEYDSLILQTRDRLSGRRDDKVAKSIQGRHHHLSNNSYQYNSVHTDSNVSLTSKAVPARDELSPYRNFNLCKEDFLPKQSKQIPPFHFNTSRDAYLQAHQPQPHPQAQPTTTSIDSSMTKEDKDRLLIENKSLHRELNWFRKSFKEVTVKLNDIRLNKDTILNDFLNYQKDTSKQIKAIEAVLSSKETQDEAQEKTQAKERIDLINENLTFKFDLVNSLQKTKKATKDLNDKTKEVEQLKEELFYKDKQIVEIKDSLSKSRKKIVGFQKGNAELQLLFAQQQAENAKMRAELKEANEKIELNQREIEKKSGLITQLADLKNVTQRRNEELIEDIRKYQLTLSESARGKESGYVNQEEMSNRETLYIKEILALKTQLLSVRKLSKEANNKSIKPMRSSLIKIVSEIELHFLKAQHSNAVQLKKEGSTLSQTLEEKNGNTPSLTKQIQSLRQSMSSLNEEKTKLISDIKALEAAYHQLESASNQHKADAINHQSENQKLLKQINDLNRDMQKLNTAIGKLNDEMTSLKLIKTRLEKENEEYQIHLPRLKEEIKHLTNKNKELAKYGRIVDYEKKVCDEEGGRGKEKEKQLEEARKSLEVMHVEKEEVKKESDALKAANSAYELQIKDLSSSNKTLNETHSKDESIIQELKNTIKEAKQKQKAAEEIQSNLSEEYSALKESHQCLKTAATSLTSSNEELTKENGELIKERSTLKEELSALYSHKQTLEENIGLLKAANKMFTKEKQDSHLELTSIKQECFLVEETNKMLNEKVSSLETTLAQVTNDNFKLFKELNDQVGVLKEENSDFIKDKINLLNQLDSSQKQIVALKEEGLVNSKAISSLKEANSALQTDYEGVVNQLSQKKEAEDKHIESIALLSSTTQKLQDDNKALKQENDVLTQTASEYQQALRINQQDKETIESITNSNSALSKENANLSQRLSETQKIIESLQAKNTSQIKGDTLVIKDQKEKINSLMQKNSDMKKQLSQLQNQIQRSHLEKSQYDNDKQFIQSQLNKAKEDLSVQSKELTSLQEANALLSIDKSLLEASIASVKAEKDNLSKMAAQLKEEINQLKQSPPQEQSVIKEEVADKLKNENHILKNRNKLLNKDIALLKEESEAYKIEAELFPSTKKDNETLKAINDNLTSQLTQFSQIKNNSNNTLEQENVFLKRTIEQQNQTIAELKSSNETMEKDYYYHLKQIESLENHLQKFEKGYLN